MTAFFRFLTVLWLGCLSLPAADLIPKHWTVDGVEREALLHVPTKTDTAAPLVFVFHGHGGNMRNTQRTFAIHELWPEAMVVYMQGLKTPGKLTDPEGKRNGWQNTPGDQDDRDLKFFDAVLASLKADYAVDVKRIYSTGHSNGGGFTYLLWAMRGEVFAAVAPSASAAPRVMALLKPKPVMHIAGESDPLVKFAWQKATIERLVEINQCGAPVTWDQDDRCSFYPSKIGTPVVTALHPGGHEFRADTPPLIVKFFKQHAKK